MTAAAGGTYFWNDIVDVDSDRRHPIKRWRPVAAGEVSVPLARIVGVALMAAALVLAALTGRWLTMAVVAAYLLVTVAYSLLLKRVPVVDLLVVAAGFVLRALAGAAAVDVPLSGWPLLCISFGSLFIVAGKRYAELLEFGDDAVRGATGARRLHRVDLATGVDDGGRRHRRDVLPVGLRQGGAAGHEPAVYQLSVVPVAFALLRYRVVLEAGGGGARRGRPVRPASRRARRHLDRHGVERHAWLTASRARC